MTNNTHIAHMLRTQAEKYKNREVFRHKEDDKYVSTSWSEFINQAKNISLHLLEKGVKHDDKIGIFSQNCPQWTCADMGIMATRAVVVPIYSTSTFDQLKYIVDETEMKVLFVGNDEQLNIALDVLKTSKSLQTIISFENTTKNSESIISYNTIIETEYSDSLKNLYKQCLSETCTDDIATIIYTSGTTGTPKGAVLSHKNFMTSFKLHQQRLSLDENDVSLCFLPLSHIFERAWTFFVLHQGAVNVYNENPKEIVEILPQVKPTVMCVVPRFFEKTYDGIISTTKTWSKAQFTIFNWAVNIGHQYIEYKKDQKAPPFSLRLKHTIADKLVFKKVRKVFGGNIRYMPCSGAAMSSHLRRFFHALGLFVNYGYGATETLATVSCMRSDTYDFENTGTIMPEIKVKISDDNMILVKGDTIFKGYYKKPEETNEVLKDGWYYTGDEGEILANNTLLMKERLKDIIKTSTGKYISPQKVELILSRSEFIEQVCVIGDNRRYLTALIVPIVDNLRKISNNEQTIKNNKELIKDSTIIKAFQVHLNELQSNLPKHEHIVKFTLLDAPFSIDNTMLTSTLKIRRKQVNKVYKDIIETMY